jgi:hypothetical protein
MKLLDLLLGKNKNKNKNKNVVLIPYRKKTSNLRACNEIVDCIALCQIDCPSDECGFLCSNDSQEAFAPEELSQKIIQQNNDNINSVFFGGNNINFKNSIVTFEGVKSVLFGKAICDSKEFNCTYVTYDSNFTGVKSLIKIYNYLVKDKKLFFNSNEEKNEYKHLLKSMNIEDIELVQIKDFEK